MNWTAHRVSVPMNGKQECIYCGLVLWADMDHLSAEPVVRGGAHLAPGTYCLRRLGLVTYVNRRTPMNVTINTCMKR